MKNTYNIVFAGDENYIKFIAVTITSIVKKTDKSKNIADYGQINQEIHGDGYRYYTEIPEKEEYIFHILTDKLEALTLSKLEQLEKDLNEIFPVKIKYHTLSTEEFHGLPTWRKSYIPYLRLKISEVLEHSIEKVLYLDGDIIVNCDIRELFSLDMKDKAVAALLESEEEKKFASIYDGKTYIHKRNYFNSGVMLINFKKWNSLDVKVRSIAFLKQYLVSNPDQDALNYCIDEFIPLSCSWNNPCYEFMLNKNDKENTAYDSDTWIEHICETKEIKIIHYVARKKPWLSTGFKFFNYEAQFFHVSYYIYWWHFAKQTTAFKEELLALQETSIYKKNTTKENRLRCFISRNTVCYNLYVAYLKYKELIRPYRQKLEAPFKRIRHKKRMNLKIM